MTNNEDTRTGAERIDDKIDTTSEKTVNAVQKHMHKASEKVVKHANSHNISAKTLRFITVTLLAIGMYLVVSDFMHWRAGMYENEVVGSFVLMAVGFGILFLAGVTGIAANKIPESAQGNARDQR